MERRCFLSEAYHGETVGRLYLLGIEPSLSTQIDCRLTPYGLDECTVAAACMLVMNSW